MSRIIRGLGIIILANVVNGSAAAAQKTPPLWGKLSPGPHAVGFRSTWQRDYSRRYNITFDDRTTYAPGKSPRPILVNVWYPAKIEPRSTPMRHRDYLAIGSDDPQLARLAAKLVEYERTIVCKEVMGKSTDELSDKERKLLDEFWDTPTASHREAPPHDGKFPMVIYHAGAQSSYEDNAVCCEFIARPNPTCRSGHWSRAHSTGLRAERTALRLSLPLTFSGCDVNSKLVAQRVRLQS